MKYEGLPMNSESAGQFSLVRGRKTCSFYTSSNFKVPSAHKLSK
jgi:hypothetical protein